MAVIVSSDPSQVNCHKDQRKRVAVYDVRPPTISSLCAGIINTDWFPVNQTENVTEMYRLYFHLCKAVIESCVPFRRVSMGPRDPDSIKPLIKSLLKSQNQE